MLNINYLIGIDFSYQIITSVKAQLRAFFSLSLYSNFWSSSTSCSIRNSSPPNNAAVSNAKLQQDIYEVAVIFWSIVTALNNMQICNNFSNIYSYLLSRPLTSFAETDGSFKPSFVKFSSANVSFISSNRDTTSMTEADMVLILWLNDSQKKYFILLDDFNSNMSTLYDDANCCYGICIQIHNI